MKEYEIYSNLKAPKGANIIIRLDGRNFHTLSHKLNLEKPYDNKFSQIMCEVGLKLFQEFSPKFIYTFSDEISILLSEIPFSHRIEKLNSVFASIAASSFTLNLNKIFNTQDMLISFDSRIIPLNDKDIDNYFKWRQDEAWRNCINSYGIWALNQDYSKEKANKKFKGMKSKDIHELLFQKNINLNNIETWKKRGIGIYKKTKQIEGFNPKSNEKTLSTRKHIYTDYNLGLFGKDFSIKNIATK